MLRPLHPQENHVKANSSLEPESQVGGSSGRQDAGPRSDDFVVSDFDQTTSRGSSRGWRGLRRLAPEPPRRSTYGVLGLRSLSRRSATQG